MLKGTTPTTSSWFPDLCITPISDLVLVGQARPLLAEALWVGKAKIYINSSYYELLPLLCLKGSNVVNFLPSSSLDFERLGVILVSQF